MSQLPDRVTLDDFNEIPDMTITEQDVHGRNGAGDPTHVAPIRIVTLDQFVSVTEDVADPLIGSPNDALLPVDGLLLMYGDGGAGKTTLSIDAIAHLAAGVDWLDITVTRPLRVLLIENEGPRGPFRERLAAKIAAWPHGPFADQVAVLEDPWTQFTLTEPEYRQALARAIDELDIDLVVVGPLASLGAKGTGTPDEVNEFDQHVKDLRAHASRPFALWIVHHENKAGDVSGAWERYPDTLVHIQAQGNGRTRVYWRKVRWSSTLHGTSSNLVWDDARGFTIEQQTVRDYTAELEAAFRADDAWRTAPECKNLIKAGLDMVKPALISLVESGTFVTMKGPPGRHSNAICWKLRSDSESSGHTRSDTQLGGFPGSSDSLTPPIKESEGESDETDPVESDSPAPSQTTKDTRHDEDEIQRILEKHGDLL